MIGYPVKKQQNLKRKFSATIIRSNDTTNF